MYLKQAILRRLAVKKNVQVGHNFHVGIGTRVWAPRSLTIGHDVYVGKYSTIEVDGAIGDSVLIGNCVGLVGRRDHDMSEVGTPVRQSRWVGDNAEILSDPLVVGSDVWIGYGVTILSGVKIGDSAVIGAGSTVISDIPANSIAVGSPARVIRNRFAEGDFSRHWHELEKKGYRRMS